MYPNICHIYGPLYINSYGLAGAIGIVIFTLLMVKNEKFKSIISYEKFKDVIAFSIIIGMVGGRLLWAIEDWNSIESIWKIFAIWEPGYSFLGTLIAILVFMPLYLKKNNVAILPFLDLASIYVPLMHSIARIGCFLSGCCHGIPTNSSWGIVYTHPDVVVPTKLKFINIHPTQLYTSFFLFCLFIAMYYFFKNRFKKPGQLFAIYLIFTSMERFINDFYRSDRDFYNTASSFSSAQWLSIAIFAVSIIFFLNITFISYTDRHKQKNYDF